MEQLDVALMDWSRAQFALTAMYHWIFVPLTLGLGIIMAIMESIYYKTKDEKWKSATQFWMTLFAINFAIGVATGIILEFQFGTNWSNYSWFVGDIFGAPLAIEGIFAFFMEATFISIMLFGWKKVSPRFHLISTWLVMVGATLSSLWILIANAWMQYPVGMAFNPDMVRNEMVDFWAVVLSPVAINKFLHTVYSGWVVGALFVIGVSAWFLLKKREIDFAIKSIKVGAIFGLVATVLVIWTGDGSAYEVAQKQPMKLAAMEGLYEGTTNANIIAVGVLNPNKKAYNDEVEPLLFKIDVPVPGLLSFLSYRDFEAFVPGIKDIVDGGYTMADGSIALSFVEKQARGQQAIAALAAYKEAMAANDTALAAQHRAVLDENYAYFGYGYLNSPEELIPNVPIVFYAFHIMVTLGMYFLAFFALILFLVYRKNIENLKWVHLLAIFSIPLGYVAGQAGWIVAEIGRQPWVIQDILPISAAISGISVVSVIITFSIFFLIFTVLLIAELRIMFKQINKGPGSDH